MRLRHDPDRVEEWFAWHPVTMGNDLVWLERVTRRRTKVLTSYGYVLSWDYEELCSE